MFTDIFAFLCRFTLLKRVLWRSWYEFLALSYRENTWTFMNYGYLPSPDASPLTLNPDDEPDRYCIQLYHFVAGACDLAGKHVVEVGSGKLLQKWTVGRRGEGPALAFSADSAKVYTKLATKTFRTSFPSKATLPDPVASCFIGKSAHVMIWRHTLPIFSEESGGIFGSAS